MDMLKPKNDNYLYWKVRMEDHLYCEGLHEPITKEMKPDGKTDKEWEFLNHKVVDIICKHIDPSLFEHVSTYTNAYELWTKVEAVIKMKMYENKVHMIRQLVKLKYKEGQPMIEYLNYFRGPVNQLRMVDIKFEDEMQALLLLNSLTESWNSFVITLTHSTLEAKLTMDIVVDSLLNEEARRRVRGVQDHTCEKSKA